jgi:hypothetical protein
MRIYWDNIQREFVLGEVQAKELTKKILSRYGKRKVERKRVKAFITYQIGNKYGEQVLKEWEEQLKFIKP